MPHLHRQKNTIDHLIFIALLCLASSLVVGFSKPYPGGKPVNLEAAPLPLPVRLDVSLADGGRKFAAWQGLDVFGKPLQNAMISLDSQRQANRQNLVPSTVESSLPTARPVSFASEELMQPVLGGVRQRVWLEASPYSADRVREQVQGIGPREFYGVGFPDVLAKGQNRASHARASKQSTHWKPMVTWRQRDNIQEQTPEAIAFVRCMGLSPQAVAKRADLYESLITETAREYDVSVNLVKAIVTKESCFNSDALSPVGAQGLMQLMPDTARWLKVKNSLDPADNLRAGVRYIAALQAEFESLELALAAYNAGPGNVRRYKGVPPFPETVAYVQSVQSHYRRYRAAEQMMELN